MVLVGRNPESGQVAQVLLGEAARVYSGDASDPATAEKAIDLCLEAFGDFDGMYHVAEVVAENLAMGHCMN